MTLELLAIHAPQYITLVLALALIRFVVVELMERIDSLEQKLNDCVEDLTQKKDGTDKP